MKALLPAAAAALWATAAVACDDHIGTCEIEEWRWRSSPLGGYLTIEGVTTCNSGYATIRLYEGDGGRFLGIANGSISGHAVQARAIDVNKATDLAIKYSIEPD